MKGDRPEEVEYANRQEFSLFPWNPKRTEEEKYKKLKNNIKETGMTEPVKVRDTPLGKEIWDGEDRYKIAKELGIDEIPYINYGEMETLETKVKRANTSMESGSVDTEVLYEEFTRCLEEEDMSIVDIAEKFGRHVRTVRHGIKAWKEKEDGAGKELDEDEREQISFNSWKNISKLPERMREDAAKKRAQGNLGGRELEKTAMDIKDQQDDEEQGETPEEPQETEQEEEEEESSSESTETETSEEEKTVTRDTSIPEPVTLYVPSDKYEKLEGLTEEDESVGEKALAMVSHCLENNIDP